MSSMVNDVKVKIYRTPPIKNPGYANDHRLLVALALMVVVVDRN